jgi:hypothetical protein
MMPLVYGELHRMTSHHMSAQTVAQTPQATALINEAYLRLAGDAEREWENRDHFFRIAARVLRHVLLDHARRESASKPGGEKKDNLQHCVERLEQRELLRQRRVLPLSLPVCFAQKSTRMSEKWNDAEIIAALLLPSHHAKNRTTALVIGAARVSAADMGGKEARETLAGFVMGEEQSRPVRCDGCEAVRDPSAVAGHSSRQILSSNPYRTQRRPNGSGFD